MQPAERSPARKFPGHSPCLRCQQWVWLRCVRRWLFRTKATVCMRVPANLVVAERGRSLSLRRKMDKPSPASNSASTLREECDVISRWIDCCAKNRFLVFTGTFLLLSTGIWSLRHIPLDALPDISDVQVIIHTPWPGQPPSLIEDQVTYPIVTKLLAAPNVKAVNIVSKSREACRPTFPQSSGPTPPARDGSTNMFSLIALINSALPSYAAFRIGICAINSKPCPALPKSRPSEAS